MVEYRRLKMNTDVAICYVSSDGVDWASYIKDKLVCEPYGINCGLIDVASTSFTRDLYLQHSKVNVFFITPDFLEQSDIQSILNLDKDTTITVLTGVERDDLILAVKDVKYDILTDSIICDLQQNEESVRNLLITIIHVFENVEIPEEVPMFVLDEDTNPYSDLPMPRQVNALHHAFLKDDKVYVLLERPTDAALTIKTDGHGAMYPEETTFAVYSIPYKGSTNSTITVFQGHNKLGECALNVPHTQTSNIKATSKDQTETKACVSMSFKENSTQTITIPDKNCENIPDTTRDILELKETSPTLPPKPCAMKDFKYANIKYHSENTDISSKTEPISLLSKKSKLDLIRELLESETDPIHLLCECLQIENSYEILDKKMASMMEFSETLKRLPYSRTDCREENSQSTWPSLVHFGAQYNLFDFCTSLRSNPIMYKAFVQANKDGHLPHDLARLHGHTKLADMLLQFAESVRANKEGKYDSGYSATSSVASPRSSTTTYYPETPPTPNRHIMSISHEYDSDEYDSDACNDYVKMNHVDILPSSAPSRTSFGNYSPKCDTMRPSTPQRDGSAYNNNNNRVLKQEPASVKHKDIVSLLGLSDAPEDTSKDKAGIFRRLFKAKKKHGKSDSLTPQGSPTLHKKEGKDLFQHTTRSSGTSSSIASTYSSESSSQNKYDDELEHKEKRNSGKKKAKNSIPQMLTNSKIRQSMRIKHAVEDTNLAAPSIPRKKIVKTEF